VIGLIDPLGLAESIIARRTDIAHEWKIALGETAVDHMQLQKSLLERMMGKPVEAFRQDAKDSQQQQQLGDSAGRPSFD